MVIFPAIRRLQQRHPMVVRGMLSVLLALVTFATMPKWVAHSHGAGHDVVVALTVASAAEPPHDDADEPAPFSADPAHVHVHYLGGVAVTVPLALLNVCPPAVMGRVGAPWHAALTPDAPLTSLHRPPIV